MGKTETEMYEEVCKPQFKEILDVVNHINKRLFQSNGERALVELVRDNKKETERVRQKLTAHINDKDDATFIDDKPVKTQRISIGKGLLSAENYKPADIFKIGLAVVICLFLGALLVNMFHLHGTVQELRATMPIEKVNTGQ